MITCICPTRNRRKWLPEAIDCFLQQTYTDAELLILAEGEPVGDLIPQGELERGRIRFVHVEGSQPMTIGEKRNMACDLAKGEVIAHWDDDDYSAPRRLELQLAAMHKACKVVAGYRGMKFTDGMHWWQYESAGVVLGTSLMYHRAWWQEHRFAGMQVGEDSDFVAKAMNARAIVVEPDQNLMYASVHEGNTSPRKIAGGCWTLLPGFQWADGGMEKAA